MRDGRFDLGDGLEVDEGLTERALRAARPDAIPIVQNGPWRSWRINPVTFEGRRCIADVYFHYRRCWQLHLFLLDVGGRLGLDAEKAAHDAFLEGLLGPPPWRFDWGRIEADADPRSDSASIIVGFGPNPLLSSL